MTGELENCDEDVGQKRLCDVFFVKAKAMIAGSRPGQARKVKDLELLVQLFWTLCVFLS